MRFLQRISFLAIVVVFCLGGSFSRAASLPFYVTNAIPVPDDLSQLAGNEINPAIAICPLASSNLNYSNMCVASMSDVDPGILIAYTTNQGKTWGTNLIATNNGMGVDANGLLAASGEPTVTWDAFGNLFLAYIPYTYEGVAVALSTNGGESFAAVTNLVFGDATDQPRLTTPALGSGIGALWLVYKDYSLLRAPLVVQGLLSTGLGTNAGFGPVKAIPGSTNSGGFPDIAVGPAGQVMVAYQTNANLSGPASIMVSVNTNAFGTNLFGTAVTAATDSIGGFTYIGAEETGIGINATPGLAWDDNPYSAFYKRAYLVYTARGGSGNLVIGSRYSVNNGAVWTAEAQVNDDTFGTNDHFFPRVALDPTTGVLAYSWLDCRNDLGSSSAVVTYTSMSNVVFHNFVVTNVSLVVLTNPANGSVSYTATDLSGVGTNYAVTVTATDVYGVKLGASGLTGSPVTNVVSIYNSTNIGGTNVVLYFVGTNTASGPPATNTAVSFNVVDNFNDAYTQGSGDQEVQLYTTVSTNGAASFLANQPIVTPSMVIVAPAVGYVSSVTRSTSLLGFGNYTGLAFYEGVYFPVWPDNSDITANNPDGETNFDIYTSEIVVPTADLSTTVTWSPNPVISGGVITFSLVISNAGPFPAPNFTAVDVLPNNVAYEHATPALNGVLMVNNQTLTFTWPSITSLAPHASLTNTILVQATSSDYATNVATVSSSLPDTVPTNNTVTNVILLDGEDLALNLVPSSTNVSVGTQVTYTLSVTNLGPAANGAVYVTNVLPTELGQITNILQPQGTYTLSNNLLVFNLGNMASNQVLNLSYTATALSLGVKFQTATVTAVVGSLDYDTNLLNNTAVSTVNILGEDLEVGLSASETNANIGDLITYTLNITNLGPAASGTVSFIDVFSTNLGQVTFQQFPPQGSGSLNGNVIQFNLGSVAAGQSVTMVYSGVALSFDASDTNIFNEVQVTSTDFDTNLVNNFSETVTAVNGEDLAVGVFGNPATVPTNQIVTYTVIVTNLGPSSTGLISLTNTLSTNQNILGVLQSTGSYAIFGNTIISYPGQLVAGQTSTLVFQATPTSLGTAVDTAAVGSTDFDTNLANNVSVLNTPIITLPNLVSNFSVTPFASSAMLSWLTPYNATVQVAYGQTPSYGSITSLGGPDTNHLMLLTGLARDTTYYFSAMSWQNGIYYATNGSFSTVDTLILNTQDASYSNFWMEGSPALSGIYGAYFNDAYTATNTPSASATYTPLIGTPGLYNVSVWYPQSTAFTTNAPVVVTGGTNAIFRAVNQATNGGQWRSLATNLYFAAGKAGNVVIYNNTGETNRLVAANAMMWQYATNQDYTPSSVPAWWASIYFGTNLAAAAGDYVDYVFGTPPGSDAAHTPAMWFGFIDSNDFTVTFSPWQGGRTYSLQTCTNLSRPTWTTLTNQPVPDSNSYGYGVFTVTQTNMAQNFFRVSAQMSTNY